MDRMKTFLIYALCIIGLWILSEFLINVGLNSTYRDITRKDENSQVVVYQAQADLINGRIKGLITNSEPEELSGKYIAIDFYSTRDMFLGKHYIEVGELEVNESKTFEVYFKLKETDSYEISIVDEKDSEESLIEVIKEELTKPERLISVIIAMLVIW